MSTLREDINYARGLTLFVLCCNAVTTLPLGLVVYLVQNYV